LHQWLRNGAGVEDLAFTSSGSGKSSGLVVATADGLPYIAAVRETGLGVTEELVGLDCDQVGVARVVGNDTWIAGGDGLVRVYSSLS